MDLKYSGLSCHHGVGDLRSLFGRVGRVFDANMKFLPYERLKIVTSLSREEILKRLENAIEPKRHFRLFASGTKPYQGSVEGSHFEVSRIIRYRNSFLPIIKGDVQSEISGSTVYITMHPHIFVTAFMILWLGAVGFFFLAFLYSFVSSSTNPSIVFIPGGMFVFGYGMFLGGFKFESIKSKKFFRELLEARDVEEMGFANPFETAS